MHQVGVRDRELKSDWFKIMVSSDQMTQFIKSGSWSCDSEKLLRPHQELCVLSTHLDPFVFDPVVSLFLPLATSCNWCRPDFITLLQSSPDGISIDRRAQAISIIILTSGLQEFYGTNSSLHGSLVIWFRPWTNWKTCTSVISVCHLDGEMIHWGTDSDTDAAAAPHLFSWCLK